MARTNRESLDVSSETLGEGVSRGMSQDESAVYPILILQFFSPTKVIFAGVGFLLSVCPSH